jgi:DNA-binding transcriptional regulator YiaG
MKLNDMAAASVKIPVNANVFRCARESIGIDPSKAAKRASVAVDVYRKWEAWEDVPSMPRLRKLANLYKRPLPVFFLAPCP